MLKYSEHIGTFQAVVIINFQYNLCFDQSIYLALSHPFEVLGNWLNSLVCGRLLVNVLFGMERMHVQMFPM